VGGVVGGGLCLSLWKNGMGDMGGGLSLGAFQFEGMLSVSAYYSSLFEARLVFKMLHTLQMKVCSEIPPWKGYQRKLVYCH
jgi:hypothetical protein